MTDKPLIQEQLSERLTSVINKTISTNPKDVQRYTTAFWQIISLEWNGIDYYRMDKYYLLIRRMIFHIFKYLESHKWNNDSINIINILSESILNHQDTAIPDGLRIFVCQVWIEEGCKSLDNRIPDHAIRIILRPLLDFISKYNKKHISTKADQELYDAIIKSKNHLNLEIISDMYFEYGSNSETLDHQRKLFYRHHEQLSV